MAEAVIFNEANEINLPAAAAAYDSGDVVQIAGMPCVVKGTGGVASGDPVSFAVGAFGDFATASGTTFSAGVAVDWDDTAKLVVADTTGDFSLGTVAKAKVSGELVTRVLCDR